MSLSTRTPRQGFREALAEVAAKAKAKLPACNGRVEKAVALVLHGDVFWTSDGTAEVASGTDPLTVHRVTGTTCSCDDNQYGRAPQGLCKHVLAVMIQTRVRTLLPQGPGEPDPAVILPEEMEVWGDNDPEEPLEPPTCPVEPTPAAPPSCPEAAFSLTLKGTVGGQDALLSVRGMTADEFTRNLAAIRGLLDARPQPAQPQPTVPQCPQHGPLKPSTKGTGWYCPQKLQDGSWCQGKGRP